MDSGYKEDLRGAFIVAMIAVMLFVVLLFQLAVKGVEHGYRFAYRLDSARQPVDRALVDPGEHKNATEVPVFCHHFLRGDPTPVEFFRIIGGLFFSLPLLSDMDIWTQSKREFEREMRHLHDEGYTAVTMGELAAWRRGQLVLPEKSVVITFDDGDRSVLDVAYPILKTYSFKATLFIVTSHVGQNWKGVESLTWDDLAFMQASGLFAIESHTHALHHKEATRDGSRTAAVAWSQGYLKPPAGEGWRDVILEDLLTSRNLIAERLDHDAKHLAWPYGESNAALDSVAAAAGFRTVSTLLAGMNGPIKANRPSLGAEEVYNRHIPADEAFCAGVPTFLPRLASTRFAWERYSVRRYTITARTSIRDYKQMLAQ